MRKEPRNQILHVVGIGPGSREQMTLQALRILDEAEVVVGYRTYTALIEDLLVGKTVVSNGMRGEAERCRAAIDHALAGKRTVIVSSGDPGIYGMAGLVYTMVDTQEQSLQVAVVPGVTASSAAASLLGAPLMHDHAVISLSDLMTDWHLIEKRLRLAAEADLVIALYNPRSHGRPNHLTRALSIITETLMDNRPVGVVKNAYRAGEVVIWTTTDRIDPQTVDMNSLVIVGNSRTAHLDTAMVTPRGYLTKEDRMTSSSFE